MIEVGRHPDREFRQKITGISMAAEQSKLKGPDLGQGVPLGDIPDGGMVGGHVGDSLTNLENDPIARQREGHSRSAC